MLIYRIYCQVRSQGLRKFINYNLLRGRICHQILIWFIFFAIAPQNKQNIFTKLLQYQTLKYLYMMRFALFYTHRAENCEEAPYSRNSS
jgi:hypothetical protein